MEHSGSFQKIISFLARDISTVCYAVVCLRGTNVGAKMI